MTPRPRTAEHPIVASTPPVRALIVDDEPLARAHLRSLLEGRADIVIIGECGDGATAVSRIREASPDLVLLDVQMPERDGFDVVRDIGPERMPAVIFVTAYDQHALAAFEVHAIDYILKPVNRARFAKSIDRVVQLLQAARATATTGERSATAPLARMLDAVQEPRAGSDRLAVRAGERLVYLRMSEIDWIEADDDVARLHVGKQCLEHRTTLSQLEERLPAQLFVRVHRSAIVNVERIREFVPWFQGDWIIVLHDGTRVQTGKSYRARVRKLIDG